MRFIINIINETLIINVNIMVNDILAFHIAVLVMHFHTTCSLYVCTTVSDSSHVITIDLPELYSFL